MKGDQPIRDQAKVIGLLKPGVYRLEMRNRMRTMGFTRRACTDCFEPGDTVSVELSAYDLSRARITGKCIEAEASGGSR